MIKGGYSDYKMSFLMNSLENSQKELRDHSDSIQAGKKKSCTLEKGTLIWTYTLSYFQVT